jgi:hypothetical protein
MILHRVAGAVREPIHRRRGVDRVQVVFNNNYGDQGQRNATL